MQVYLSENYIPAVILPCNYTSLPSITATLLVTYLTTVLQLSEYFVFYSKDTPIQLGLP